jgi:hypothetical protein
MSITSSHDFDANLTVTHASPHARVDESRVPQHVLRDDQRDLTWQTDGMLVHAVNEPRAVVLSDQPHRCAGAVIATMDAPARHL